MKKGIIIVVIIIAAIYLLISQGIALPFNDKNKNDTQTSNLTSNTNTITKKIDEEKNIEEDVKENVVEDNVEKENTSDTIENKSENTTPSKKEQTTTIQTNNENNKEVKVEKKQKKEPNNDEFYDTSDRDPFAEEQHKADVPLVLYDKDGNEAQPNEVYWDEESGRGTLDPGGYIPEGLPPGAVFVCEVDEEELERLKEEFGD